jgi:hypothetical protein
VPSARVCADANLAQIWAKDVGPNASVRMCHTAGACETGAPIRSYARGRDASARWRCP